MREDTNQRQKIHKLIINTTSGFKCTILISKFQKLITASSTAKVLIPAPNSAIEKFLQVPPNPAVSSVKSSSCGRVLTSCENLKLLEEKRKKDEEAKKKEEQKRLREERKIQKEQQKCTKVLQKKTKATGITEYSY